MSQKIWQRFFSIFLLFGLVFGAVLPSAAAPAAIVVQKPSNQESSLTPTVGGPFTPVDTTGMGPVSSILPVPYKVEPRDLPTSLALPKAASGNAVNSGDPAVDKGETALTMPTPIINFEAGNNTEGVYPPDTDGDVGPNHYVQMVNLHTTIYDKAGNILYGPFSPNQLWPSGDPCNITNDGDVVALYDQLADRWLLSQFGLPNYPSGPYYECIAVSKTSLPTNNPNDWYLYTILASTTKMNDYPKLAVWPDAYYMTANQFTGGANWGGAGVWALQRDAMLIGNPVQFVYFDLYSVNTNYGGMLPVDLDGSTVPPTGAPGYFVEVDDSAWIPPVDAVRIWEFHVDWTTPANSTFGISGEPNATLPVDNFDLLPCVISFSSSCIPQSGTSVKLDSLGDRLMFRAVYRNFGDHEAIAFNHTVLGSDTDVAGIRWYELRDPGGTPSIYQQGTFAPTDGLYRWMGSLAFDHVGNIALGYSVSSGSTFPSIRYTGRLASDPLGTMNQGEATIIDGSGAQTGSASRWGDYSAMSVDPVDDCTFWYTQEYIQTTGTAPWRTRVAAFKFPGCSSTATGTLDGTVTDATTTLAISGANIQATLNPGQIFNTTTLPDGTYELTLPIGTYEVAASAYGYDPSTVSGIDVISGTTTTQDFALNPAAMVTVDGTVTDVNTGWPLYAKITIDGYPGDPIWTDPVTGYYSIDLQGGLTYTFHVEAWVAGYLPYGEAVLVNANMTKDFALDVDAVTCNAPGYSLQGGIAETFDDTGLPVGWAIVNNSGIAIWRFDDPAGRGNLTGGTGNFSIADSDYAYIGNMDTELWTPVMDLSSAIKVPLVFKYDYFNLGDTADVDVSNDSGVTWVNVWRQTSSDRGPKTATIDITALAAGQNDVVVRWHYYNANWAWWWEVDDVAVYGCTAAPGGLVIGNVFDENSNEPLVGADVSNDSGGATTTVANPADLVQAPAFYTLFSPAGPHDFTANKYYFGEDVVNVSVVQSDTVGQNFYLAAGRLTDMPQLMDVTVAMGYSTSVSLTLTDIGGMPVSWVINELDKGMATLKPYDLPIYGVVKPFRQSFKTTEGIKIDRPLPDAAPLAAGDVIRSWAPTQSAPWGIAYEESDTSVWVSEGWGTDQIFEYSLDGNPTSRSYPITWNPDYGPADLAYNYLTGMLWSLDVFTDDCIHEIDPASGVTGNTICPGFPVSQRGLAYDGSNDTWFAGGWNDAMVYHFDSAGNPLGSWNTGLPISGLAYNPDSMHLFVMVNSDIIPNPVYVLDASNNMALIGQFDTTKGFGAYSGAGLEMDCDGHLWAVDQNASIVYEIDSGETTTMCYQDVPWLSEDPISGTIVSAADQTIQVSFDAGVPEVTQLGKYFAQLKIVNDTPYFIENIPVTMTVVAATPPVVSFTSNSPVLLGEPMVFTNTSDSGFPAVVEYEWNFGDGTSETYAFGDAVSHLYSHYGRYTVTLTGQNPVSSDTATAQVVVQAAPQVSFTSNSPVMISNPIVFTNTSDLGYPAVNVFTWDFGDGVVETLSLGDPVSHTYANAGTYTVTLEACNAVDCDTFTADVVVGYIGIYLPIINKP